MSWNNVIVFPRQSAPQPPCDTEPAECVLSGVIKAGLDEAIRHPNLFSALDALDILTLALALSEAVRR